MINDLLPIGSIVTLNNGTKKLMIFGVKQSNENDKTIYDYIGVLYPEGYIDPQHQFLFNTDNIAEIHFKGYEDDERQGFLNKLEQYYNQK